MIVRLIQKTRTPTRTHTIYYPSDVVYGYGSVPSLFLAHLQCNNQNYDITTDSVDVANIIKDNSCIGTFKRKIEITKRILGIPIGYEYIEADLFGNIYCVYESGLGPNQHFFTFYSCGQTVAVIHKDDRVINYLNTYSIYAKEEIHLTTALLFNMYLESTAFFDRSGGFDNNVIDSPYYSKQKELRNKFDPKFISDVIALETNKIN